MYGEFREMINLQKKKEIILLHVRENYSRRKIAKQLGLDRATVGKYIDEYEEKKRKTFTGRYGGRHRGINTIYC
jgi:transposase